MESILRRKYKDAVSYDEDGNPVVIDDLDGRAYFENRDIRVKEWRGRFSVEDFVYRVVSDAINHADEVNYESNPITISVDDGPYHTFSYELPSSDVGSIYFYLDEENVAVSAIEKDDLLKAVNDVVTLIRHLN